VKPLVLLAINADECYYDEDNSNEEDEECKGAPDGPHSVDGVDSE